MPKFNDEFKFPDESSAEKDEDEKLILEIEDDAPIEDRNKEPMAKEAKEELYNDELEDYSTKVKKKLIAMKRLAHDERREKEAALRAKQIYREAYDSGDTDRVMSAQERLTELSLKKDKVSNFKPRPLQPSEYEVKTPSVQAERIAVDPNAQNWKKENSWFGEDKLMTGMALALHDQLKEEGVALSSQEYYRRIDETMRQRFPDKFEEQEDNRQGARTRPGTVVAPAVRSTSPNKVRLKQSQVNLARKLGLTPEQYVKAQLELEARNG